MHKTDSDTTTKETFEPTKQYDVKFKTADQQVVVKNFNDSSDTLSMSYYEKVALIVRPNDYNQSWTIFFKEDFTGTALNGLYYTAPNATGLYLSDWIESNLNNIALQSKTDTVINGTKYYNLKISRVITFLQAFSNKTATDKAAAALLQRKSDVVTFSCYYSYNGQSSVPASGTANLIYNHQ